MDYKEIIKKVTKKNFLLRLLIGALAMFLLALNYNIFLLPNDLVIGGTSGLAIIINHFFGFSPSSIILFFNIILIIISYFTLGREQSRRTVIGSLLYPLFVELSLPLANYLIPYTNFDNILLTIIVTGILYGFATGVIYKAGYTTGGADIIMQIVNKYFHIPTGKASLFVNGIIVGGAGLIFGIPKMLYAIIIIVINTILVDKILIGISDSKMFFIYTKKEKEVANFIINEINAGYTILTTEGGYSKTKRKMLMCVVPTRDYFYFKESVLEIDKDAFFVISDCYEVRGGVKRENLFEFK